MKNVSVVRFVTSIRLFLIPVHKLHASSYGNSDGGGPSMEIVKRELSMSLDNFMFTVSRQCDQTPHE